MSVRLNEKTGLWEVRLSFNGKRQRYGTYDSEKIALAKERSVKAKLEQINTFQLKDYNLELEETEQHANWFNPLKWFKRKV